MDGTGSSSLEGNETRDERATADDTTDSSEENSGRRNIFISIIL